MDNRDSRCRRRTKSSPNWLELPWGVTAAILQKLGTIDIMKIVQRMCTQWRRICKESLTWRTIDMEDLGDHHNTREDFDIMCRRAVDRSCGGLIDLNIKSFGSNELLDYVTRRCTQIRRLRLVLCFGSITNELCEVASRLPLLEDLEISYCVVTAKALQKFGECCPHLRSLKVNQEGFRNPYDDFGEAIAIAKQMLALRHLQLFGNGLTNESLKAILDYPVIHKPTVLDENLDYLVRDNLP